MRRFIFLMVLVIVTATFGTIYIGSRTFDGVVEERPYETGLAWDEIQKRRERLGWFAAIEYADMQQGKNEIVITMTDRTRAPLEGATVDVTLSRPSTRDYDRIYPTTSLGGGRYRAMLEIPIPGLWDLKVGAIRGTDRYDTSMRMIARERAR